MSGTFNGLTTTYTPNESWCLRTPTRTFSTAKRPGVLSFHGAGSNFATSSNLDLYRALSDNLSLNVMTADNGGQSNWGNATSQTAADAEYAYLTGSGGAKTTGGVILVGISMGFMSAQRWARTNPTNVLGIVGLVGVADSDDIYNNDRSGLASSIDAAWSGNYTVNGSAQNPSHTGNPAAVASIPHLLIYSDGDTIVLSSTVLALASAIGAKAQTYKMPGDPPHNNVPSTVPLQPILSFVASLL